MEFPNLGKHCRKEYCNKLDFLPIVCDGCKEIFCSEHFSYVSHDCSRIPESRRDHQVPICPVCMAPVPSVKGQEDRAVSLHIDQDCKQETRIYTNSCSFGKCKKRELIPFACSSCKMNFCLKHRHFDVHDCKGAKTTHQRDVLAQAAMRRNNPGSQDNFKKVQGAMSEDEALARAIQASIQESPQQITVGNGQSSSQDKNKCAIS